MVDFPGGRIQSGQKLGCNEILDVCSTRQVMDYNTLENDELQVAAHRQIIYCNILASDGLGRTNEECIATNYQEMDCNSLASDGLGRNKRGIHCSKLPRDGLQCTSR